MPRVRKTSGRGLYTARYSCPQGSQEGSRLALRTRKGGRKVEGRPVGASRPSLSERGGPVERKRAKSWRCRPEERECSATYLPDRFEPPMLASEFATQMFVVFLTTVVASKPGLKLTKIKFGKRRVFSCRPRSHVGNTSVHARCSDLSWPNCIGPEQTNVPPGVLKKPLVPARSSCSGYTGGVAGHNWEDASLASCELECCWRSHQPP